MLIFTTFKTLKVSYKMMRSWDVIRYSTRIIINLSNVYAIVKTKFAEKKTQAYQNMT